ncbi:MAG: hypothetical protein WCY88_09325 [Spongiibacteraceae bacterium]
MLIFGLSTHSPSSHAQPPASCTCLWQGSFNKVAANADLIVSGEIISQKGNSADLRIERTLYDRGVNFSEFNSIIRIWGDDGKECRPAIEDFPTNSTWLMALHKIDRDVPEGFNPSTPNISYGRTNDYYLSKCGAYWLQLTEGYVTGNLINGSRWQWHNDAMNPVLLELIDAYLKDIIPDRALIEAAKPQTAAKKLMEQTKQFIQSQQ